MKILITGFEPFSENSINPSQKLVEIFPETISINHSIRKLILPVDQDKAPDKLLSSLQDVNPDAVIAFGLSAGRAKISLERVAINLLDFSIPDNAGKKISDLPVVPEGPAAYFTTLPIKPILSELIKAKVPAELSLTAGSYLCNQVFYQLLDYVTSNHLNIPAGFVHLPALPESAVLQKKSMPSMDLDIMVKAAMIMIKYLLETNQPG